MKKSLRVILVTGILGTIVAVAADRPVRSNGTPGGGGPGGWAAGGPGGGGPGAQDSFQGRGRGGMAVLDDQQRQLFQEALQKDGDKLRELDEKLRAAQKALLQATLDATYDEKALQTKAAAMAAIQVEIILVRAAALASVAPAMKPEQKQQLVESPFGMAILNSGGGGPRGGFPNAGPGGGFGGARGDGPPGGGLDQGPRAR